jgi:TonB-dependent starch-binding outer membrane protein SusC
MVFLCPILLALVLLCQAQAPTKTVSGTIKDDQGTPITGATIVVKGKKTGVVTDASGNFTITLPASTHFITVSHVGYESQDLEIGDRTMVVTNLATTRANLEEVVVVGYGSQKRKDLTGSVSSVKGSDFKDQPVTSLTAALQGRAAGVEVIDAGSQPDAGAPEIIIRGLSSLHQPNPLYIVDGVRVPGDLINIQDIASVEVLKDASAAAIYGSAAAGGVIIITTKKGHEGKPSINFTTRYGVNEPKLYKLLDRDQFIRLQNILNPSIFAGKTETDTLPNTDWVKETFRNGTEQNYNLSVAGSTPVTSYLFSGYYNRDKGVYLDNWSNIGGARVNTDYQLAKWLKVGEQLSVSQRRTDPMVPGRTDLGIHNAPFRSQPIIPVYNADGTFGSEPPGYNIAFGGANPVGSITSADAVDIKNNLNANVYADVRLPFHLDFRANMSYDYGMETQDYYQAPYNMGAVVQTYNTLSKYFAENTQVLTNEVLTYNQSFGDNHINALVGFEQIANKINWTNSTISYNGLPTFSIVPTSNSVYNITGVNDPNGLLKSYFAQVNYNYAGKYYIGGSWRQDGDYNVFGPDYKTAQFGSVSAAWVISEEKFFKNSLSFFNQLKLRGSWGTLGNNSIGTYTYDGLYSQIGGALGGQNFNTLAPLTIATSVNALANPGLKWETVTETNLGIDGEVLKGKGYFSVEWYNKVTSNMLYSLPLALSSGITQGYTVNIGSVQSKGVDVLVGYKDHVAGLGYDVSATLGFNSNKVTNLDGIPNGAIYDGANYVYNGNNTFGVMQGYNLTITKSGLPFGEFYGLKTNGIFKTDADAAASGAQPNAHAGDLSYVHDPKNGTTVGTGDFQPIGNPNPKLVYGINIRLTYKGFDLAALFNGVQGVQIFNGVKAYSEFLFGDGNTTSAVFGASYLGNNGLTSQPRIDYLASGQTTPALDPNHNYQQPSSYFVENGSYLKLKNLQIGYTFSNSLFTRAGVKGARLFVMANNVFTLTKYSGLDPEIGAAYSAAAASGLIGSNVGVTTRGIDLQQQYPQAKTFSAGLDVNF